MTEPNKERLREWVKALRSGEYKQTSSTLRRDDGSCCCLGVACDLALKNDWVRGKWQSETFRCQFTDESGRIEMSNLPATVADAFGIGRDPLFTLKNPILDYSVGEEIVRSATYLNDVLGLPFDQIADVIEANYGLKEVPDEGI